MSVTLLTEHHLEVLNLKGGCTGSSEATLVDESVNTDPPAGIDYKVNRCLPHPPHPPPQTLKFDLSPKPNQVFIMPQCNIHVNLFAR